MHLLFHELIVVILVAINVDDALAFHSGTTSERQRPFLRLNPSGSTAIHAAVDPQWATEEPIVFRAVLPQQQRPNRSNKKNAKDHTTEPDYYREKLLRHLDGHDVSTPSTNASSCIVEFALPTDNRKEDHRIKQQQMIELCRTLPATQLYILVRQWKKAADVSDQQQENEDLIRPIPMGALKQAIDVWISMGNDCRISSQEGIPTFSISYKVIALRKQRGRRRDSDDDEGNRLSKSVSKWLIHTMGWKPYPTTTSSGIADPTFSFQLSAKPPKSCYSLELLTMVRTWPLRDPSSKPPSTKRLESYFVARSAQIQPGEVVWDPFCRRGTLLVEAAKHWPTATYHGTDSNLGHLEHCQMNAESTSTHLHLYHNPHHQSNNKSAVDQLMEAFRQEEGKIIGVDKIMTCLPPNQSLGYYKELLQDWSRLLLPNASMILLVEPSASLPKLRKAVEQLSDRGLRISFIRNPLFSWGKNQRATLVVLNQKFGDGTAPPPEMGLMEWEEKTMAAYYDENTTYHDFQSSSLLQQLWATARAESIPWMIPYTDYRKAPRSRIRLSSGQFK